MIDLNKRVFDHFEESIRTKQMAQEVLTEAAAQAAQLLFDALANDGKILICGNGGSAADAQHFAAEMTGRFEQERMELAAVALTTDTSKNIIEAIHAAHEREMNVIAFTGRDGGKIAGLLRDGDVLLNVPYPRTARIQEVHLLLIHTLCDCIDSMLLEG